jgi:hypothetical protein
VLYECSGDDLEIIDPKAHGLGYLYPPVDQREDRDWTFEAWDWILLDALGLQSVEPDWLNRPVMMQVRMSTPQINKRLNKITRPFNFVLVPLIDAIAGFPAGVDDWNQFTLMTPFTKDRDAWLNADYTNIYDGKHYSLALEQTPNFDKVIPKTFGYILRLYQRHPEYKSLAPDGSPCTAETHGLLQRLQVVASRPHYIGKETERKWDQGEDLSLLTFKPAQFDEELGGMAKADPALIEQIGKVKIKASAREANVDRNTIRKIRRGLPVRRAVSQRVALALTQLVDGFERDDV